MSLSATPAINVETVSGGANFVLAGAGINPASFNAGWLFQSGLFKAEEITKSPVISPALIIVQAPSFQFLIAPGRIQMQFSPQQETDAMEPVRRIIGGLLKLSPTIPISAIGLNFDFFQTPTDEHFVSWNIDKFRGPAAGAVCPMELKPRFGAYFSVNFEGFRMKTHVHPISAAISMNVGVIEKLKAHKEWMHFAFNFHLDVTAENSTSKALDAIDVWPRAEKYAQSIVAKFEA